MSIFRALCVLSCFVPVVWLLRSVHSYCSNLKSSRQTNLPIISSPFDPIDPRWMLLQRFVIPLCRRLPFGLGAFTRYNRMGWSFHDKYRLHSELGDAFMHVNPGKNHLYIANPEAIDEIFLRRNDFQKPVHLYKMLEVFGRNAITVEGHDWIRHRKNTAPPFDERNSAMVWSESLRQARDMLEWWKGHGSEGVRSTDKDTRTLSLHVLAYAGFGQSTPFKSARGPPASGFSMTYGEALAVVLDHILMIIAVPRMFLRLPFAPKSWRRALQAMTELQRYMTETLEREKQLVSCRAPGAANLMSSLVRCSEEAQQVRGVDEKNDKIWQGLTDTEIYGNMFFYNFAGHETTASILTYSVVLLAAHPQWQDWLAEEIDTVFRDQPRDQAWAYNQFPRLKRCLAIMMETLRLYSPVTGIPKYTPNAPQTITINNQTHRIPPHTMIMLNIFAMHTNPRHWGPDSLTWRPSRWITTHPSPSPSPSPSPTPNPTHEELLKPPKGTYFPWSGGARICVGKKFSQVEFVAVMATLFAKHRVFPVVEEEESMEEARRRVAGVVDDSVLRMTLQVREPGRAGVVWRERGNVSDGDASLAPSVHSV